MGSEMCIRDSYPTIPESTTLQSHRSHAIDERNGAGFDRSGMDIVCLLYTSDAADERSSVDLGGRRIIKKKTKLKLAGSPVEP